ncbi:hypothetical protein B0H17DRAFT_1031325 [Mycena rosella]|uniref:Uncharacterized protein n=1 Tax=Mycena rosella TaxID=1033263 RepID=A0AAD7H081_MYCRO|nr:hypothetical protein B0H17DRAFT_1031325 [Mycena rosella]
MSDSDLYSRLLFPKKQGYPLFYPQPFDTLPEAARKNGTEIGDVGVVTTYGAFDPIFNILRAGDDPANRFGVPLGFEQVVLGLDDIAALALYHLPGSDISNTTINKKRLDIDAGIESNVFLPLGAGAVVEVSTNSKQTGLLLLPDGASRWDLLPLRVFRDYALKHGQSWYAFINGQLGRMIGSGDLYLVTGVTKSTSWSVAAVENQSGDGKVALKLKAAQVGNAGASCAWEWESASSSVNSGPRRRPGEESWRDNQTVFLRGFKVALRSTPLRRSPKVLAIVNAKWSDLTPKTSSTPFSQSRSRPSSVNGRSQSPPSTPSSGSPSDDEQSLDYVPNLYHPSGVVNEYLLDCAPDAMIAVTHDDEWASVINETDEEIPENHRLLSRISNRFNIEITSGTFIVTQGIFSDRLQRVCALKLATLKSKIFMRPMMDHPSEHLHLSKTRG